MVKSELRVVSILTRCLDDHHQCNSGSNHAALKHLAALHFTCTNHETTETTFPFYYAYTHVQNFSRYYATQYARANWHVSPTNQNRTCALTRAFLKPPNNAVCFPLFFEVFLRSKKFNFYFNGQSGSCSFFCKKPHLSSLPGCLHLTGRTN